MQIIAYCLGMRPPPLPKRDNHVEARTVAES
jgi:hypothetical protein